MNKMITKYLKQFEIPASEWEKELIKEAEEDRIPIMEKDGIDFIKQLIRIKQPKNILEIGTAIGYSALHMIDAAPNSKLVTVERDLTRHDRAKFYLEKNDHSEKIQLIYGDAFEKVEVIEQRGPYDLIFIDAAKGQYQRFFEIFSPLLTNRGVIITDNILFHGYVANPTSASKRLVKLAAKIDRYNQWLSQHEKFDTTFIPVGDGLGISIKIDK